MIVRWPLSTTKSRCVVASVARRLEAVRLHLGRRNPEQPRHLAGMRRDHDRLALAGDEAAGLAGERVQRVGVEHERHARAFEQPAHERRHGVAGAEPRARRRSRSPGSRSDVVERASAETVPVGRLRRAPRSCTPRRAPRRSAGRTPAWRPSRGRRPTRSAPTAARCAAPVFPRDPATTSTWPKSPLCASRPRGLAPAAAGSSRVSSRTSGPSRPSMTSSGMPMSATTRSPARSRAGGRTSGSFGAPSVTVSAAWMAGPITSCVSADRPLGRSIGDDRHRRAVDVGHDGLEQARQRRLQAGAEQRVDDEVVSRRPPRSAVPSPARRRSRRPAGRARPRISRFIRASPRTSASGRRGRPRRRRPRCRSVRATTKPSPPLLPRPQRTATRRSARSSKAASIAATTWRPAFSISTSDGMPISSIVRRSASRIWSALRILIALHLRPRFAALSIALAYARGDRWIPTATRRSRLPALAIGATRRVRCTVRHGDGAGPGTHADAHTRHRAPACRPSRPAALPHRHRRRDGPDGGRLPAAVDHRGHPGRAGPGPFPGGLLHEPARARADAVARARTAGGATPRPCGRRPSSWLARAPPTW